MKGLLRKMFNMDGTLTGWAIESYQNHVGKGMEELTMSDFAHIEADMDKLASAVDRAARHHNEPMTDGDIWDAAPEEITSVYSKSRQNAVQSGSFSSLAMTAIRAKHRYGNGQNEEYSLYIQGKSLFPREKQPVWAEMVLYVYNNSHDTDEYRGKALDDVVKIQKFLMKDDIDSAESIMREDRAHSDTEFREVYNMVRDICSNADKLLARFV